MASNLKSKIGFSLIVLSQVAPIFSIVVPFLGLNDKMENIIITLLFVGGKHVILLLGIAFVGKKGFFLVKQKIMSILGLSESKRAANKLQYNMALTIIFLWFLTVEVSGYFPKLIQIDFIKENYLWIVLAEDLLFLLAIFVLGGNQMITKIGRLFKWEPWELPSK